MDLVAEAVKDAAVKVHAIVVPERPKGIAVLHVTVWTVRRVGANAVGCPVACSEERWRHLVVSRSKERG